MMLLDQLSCPLHLLPPFFMPPEGSSQALTGTLLLSTGADPVSSQDIQDLHTLGLAYTSSFFYLTKLPTQDSSNTSQTQGSDYGPCTLFSSDTTLPSFTPHHHQPFSGQLLFSFKIQINIYPPGTFSFYSR